MVSHTLSLNETIYLASYGATYANARNGQDVVIAEYPWIGQYRGGSFEVNQVGLSFNQSSLPGPALEANLILTVAESYGATIQVREHDWTTGAISSFIPGGQLASKRLLGSVTVADGFTGEITIPLNVIGRRSPFKVILSIADQANNVAPTDDDTILFSNARLEVVAANQSETITTGASTQQWPINGRLKVYAEVIGGGGCGRYGEAGGGGAYSAGVVTFPASQPYTYLQMAWPQAYAQNGDATVGYDSYFDGITAKGGNSRRGGQASAGVGAIRFSGGDARILGVYQSTDGGTNGGSGASASAFGDGGHGDYNPQYDTWVAGLSPGAGTTAGSSHVEGGAGGGQWQLGGSPGGGGRGGTSTRGQVRIWWREESPTATGAVSLSAGRVQGSATFSQPPRQAVGLIALAPMVTAVGMTIVPANGAGGVSLRSPRVEALSTFAEHPAAPSIPGGTPGTGTWDENLKSYEFVLTNGRLTATHNRGYNASGSIYGTDGITTGDHSFKVTVHNPTGGIAIGVANKTRGLGQTLGWSANDVAVNSNGTILYAGGTNFGTIGAINIAGTVVEIRIKAQRFYARKNDGPWNGSASISPEAGNGVDISAIPNKPLFPVIFGNNYGLSFTGDFTAWNGTVGTATPGNWLVGVIALKGPFTSGEAGQNIQAAATVVLTAPQTAGQGFRGSSADGAISLASPAVSATGSHTRVGSGVVTLTAPSTQGLGAHGVEGSSAISLASPSASALGSYTRVGSGVVALAAPVVAADGQHTVGAQGLVSLGSPTVEVYATRGSLVSSSITLTAGRLEAVSIHARGAVGSIALSSPSTQGRADHGVSGSSAVVLQGPSVEAVAETFNEAISTVLIGSPSVEADAGHGPVAAGQVILASPSAEASASQITGAYSAVRLSSPKADADADHGVAGASMITLTAPSAQGSAVMVPVGQAAISLASPKLAATVSQAAYAQVRLWTPMAASEASHGVSTHGLISLASPGVSGAAGVGATGQGVVSLTSPSLDALAQRGTASSGAVPLAMRVTGALVHSVAVGGMVSLTIQTEGLADHGVDGQAMISLASPTVTGSLEPGLVHGAGMVSLTGPAVVGDIYVDLTTVYLQGAVVLGSPSVKARILTLPTHGQRTVLVAGEQRVVAPVNEPRSLNIGNEMRAVTVAPE